MQAYTNTEIVESRKKWAQRTGPIAMVALVGGLITNFLSINDDSYFQITLILLGVGFVFAIITSHLANRWVKEPRADQTLDLMLQKFSDEYVLFNYIMPVPHVLITPSRVYAVIVRRQSGEIEVNGSRFRKPFMLSRLWSFFNQEALGSPAADAEAYTGKLESFFRDNLDEENVPEVDAFVLFTDDEVQLSVNDPVLPVLQRNQLKRFLRDNDKQKVISTTQRKSIVDAIQGEYEVA